MKHKVIYIEWEDAVGKQGWIHPNEPLALAPIKTVGWYVAETKDSISVTTGIDTVENGYMGIQSIPKGNIKKRRYLKL